MKLHVFQIDAWIEPDGTWTYNNSMEICCFKMDNPTPRRILKALRGRNLLSPDSIYKVDDTFLDEGWWSVKLKSNEMPLFDLLEEETDVQ